MRKIKFCIIFLSTFIFSFFVLCQQKRVSFATNGQNCTNLGGSCRIICFSGETSVGSADCPTYNDGTALQQETCCKKGTQGCKIDGDDCKESADCCSRSCLYNSHQGKKICERVTPTSPVETGNICANDTSPTKECVKCFEKGNTWTALGCIETHDLTATITWFVRSAVFVASGIAFLLMASGAFQIITSSGDPKKAQAGSELITSALSGLLFIILSIFLLKLIGVDILKIPGFGS